MAKLIDDPAVKALVDKHVSAATADGAKKLHKTLKALIADIKAKSLERAADAKTAGNRDAANYLKTFGADLAAHVKAVDNDVLGKETVA